MRSAIFLDTLSGLARFSTARRVFEPQALPANLICVLAILFIAGTIGSGTFGYDRGLFLDAACSCGFVFLFAYAARWIGFCRVADGIEQIILLYLTGLLLAFCSAIVAATAVPLADSLLLRADLLLLGVDRVRLIGDMNLSRDAIRFWAIVYNSLSFTPALALVMLTAMGKRAHAWALLTAMLAAAMVSVAFIAVLPAYGVPPFPYAFVDIFDGLREGRLRTLDGSVITGMSTFPSMHAAHATMLACAFGWFGRWGAPLVVLNILMVASAVIVGGHYVVDVLAGVAIGLAAIHGSLRLHRWISVREASRSPRPREPKRHHGRGGAERPVAAYISP